MYFVPAFFAGLLFIPILLGLARFFGMYTCVRECEAQVFTLFGKVIGTIDTAGLQFPLSHFGPQALLISFTTGTHSGRRMALASTGFLDSIVCWNPIKASSNRCPTNCCCAAITNRTNKRFSTR